MPRRRLSFAERDYRATMKTLAKIRALDPAVAPGWRDKMIAYYERRLEHDKALVNAEHAAAREAARAEPPSG